MSAYDQNMTTSTLEIRLLAVILRHHARRALRWKTSAGDYWSHPPLSTPSPARATHDAKRSYAQLDRLQYTFSPGANSEVAAPYHRQQHFPVHCLSSATWGI